MDDDMDDGTFFIRGEGRALDAVRAMVEQAARNDGELN